MTAWMMLGAVSCVALSGRQKSEEAHTGNLFGSGARGRYLGVAVYAPGRMWEQVARAGAPTNAAAATLKDDEQVIVVVDSATGEVRQCGNLSGFCVAMNPWAGSATPAQGAPALLQKHSQQLDVDRVTSGRPEANGAGTPK
jgi:hypothetical protein